jgi:hypothetical protein
MGRFMELSRYGPYHLAMFEASASRLCIWIAPVHDYFLSIASVIPCVRRSFISTKCEYLAAIE